MTHRATAKTTRFKFPRTLVQWLLIPLLCLAGPTTADTRIGALDQLPKASVATPDHLNTVQEQSDQWDLDALNPTSHSNTPTNSRTFITATDSGHKPQVLTAFIPRAPPQLTPKTRIFVF
ncbi:hypothetical protein [Pseudomaricurvus sp.]|uniref:hypothetical protein n=1 Tax=Pseudomaricurvus sp. TaxID=2004510 RepID=UPI003F6CA7AF